MGEAPSEDWLKSKLETSAVFIYCGHGSGELFLAREDVAALPQVPLAILMGCSSGRLRLPGSSSSSSSSIVNRDGLGGCVNALMSPELFEPSGMALSYLAAGSPAVVGNLWDVTDRDIDRFCLALLEGLFPVTRTVEGKEEEEDSGLLLSAEGDVGRSKDEKALILSAVARARSACKLPYLVGSAPVVYGLPSELID